METTTRKLDLLLVDDDADDHYLLNQAISKIASNINLTWVDSGQKLKTLVSHCQDASHYPDIIFLDLNLPIMSGRQILKWLKQSSDCHNIPVIIYTTSRSNLDISEAYQLGANSYIVKQGSLQEITDTLKTTMNYWTQVVELPV